MNAVPFDTLALSRRLEAAGMSAPQAQGMAAALAEALAEQIPSRRDLADEGAAIRAEIGALRSEVAMSSKDLRGEIAVLGKDLRGEMRELEQRMTIRLGLMLAGAVAIMGALVKLL